MLVTAPEGMTKELWLKRCADRFVEKGGVDKDYAMDLAETALENIDGDIIEVPEDCADEDMSCWSD